VLFGLDFLGLVHTDLFGLGVRVLFGLSERELQPCPSGANMEDENEWTLEDLGPHTANDGRVPSMENAIRLLQQYRNTWVLDEVDVPTRNMGNLMQWIMTRLEMTPAQFSWNAFQEAVAAERIKLMRLQYFVEHHRIGGQPKMLLYETANILFNINDIMKHSARMLVNLSPNNMDARSWIAPEDLNTIDLDNENMFQHGEKDNTNFQNAFFHLRQVLEGCNYRRASGKFFKRIQLTDDITANAYEEVCDIKTFVQDHTSYDSNFKAWRWITNPTSNFDSMVNYLKERPIAEAPDLEEDPHQRSYAGVDGVGGGVYNHASDMFFPYDRIEEWKQMAVDVQEKRRKLYDPNYVCVAPETSDVGVIHLDCAFPYSIYDEVMAIDTEHLYLTWVEVDEYECRYGKFYPAADLQNGGHLFNLLASKADTCSYVDGLSKNSIPRPRVNINMVEWTSVDMDMDGDRITARTFVHQDGRYFRVHTGCKWFDCPTLELDHIYRCQDFIDHDRFMLYAIAGRVFYKVGERDKFEGTIFKEGTGGCGKSTEVKVYQKFWPPHRRGILSANIQTQFGMEPVARGDVAWCTELSEEPNMPQEDWQDATGGHTVVCPIKHKQDPLVVHAWHAQFWWCSNVFPKRYKNKSKQVSRRLYGVGMYKPVKPRKDDILSNILPNLGHVQRRSILAYDDWLMQQGNIDPMSSIDTLPPAFAWYYRKTVRETDPMEEFLSDGNWVVEDIAARMPMSVFRALFNEYRQHYDMGKASRWCEDVYRIPFNDRGIQVIKNGTIDWDDETLTDVDIVIGLRPK